MNATGADNNTTSGLSSDADLASLAALLEAEQSDEHADTNLVELFTQLENADSVARLMEDNLDLLLERLDGMVEGLEAAQPAEKVVVENGASGVKEAEEGVAGEEQQNGLPKE